MGLVLSFQGHMFREPQWHLIANHECPGQEIALALRAASIGRLA